jgi:hypothetical protein
MNCKLGGIVAVALLLAGVTGAPAGAVTTVWTADMETGSTDGFAEWRADGGGGEYDSGDGNSFSSSAVAHTGTRSVGLVVTAPLAGTRMFRWQEMREHRTTTTTLWYRLNADYVLTGDPLTTGRFANTFQVKSRSLAGDNDPIWYLDYRGGSSATFDLIWWCGSTRPCTLTGPHSDEDGFRRYVQGVSGCDTGDCSVQPVPSPLTWFELTMEIKQSNAFDGYIRFWQNGVKIFDLENVRTSYENCDYNAWCAANEWSVNLYSDGLFPYPARAYVDDVSTSIP